MCTNMTFCWVGRMFFDGSRPQIFWLSNNSSPSFVDILVVNQTPDTLQSLTIEFATLGDLKLVERPTTHTMAPHSFQSIKANIKVSSTETGVIFGNIVYDGPGTADTHVVVLNDIHIDIMDYIKPAMCNDNQVSLCGWWQFLYV